MGCASQEVGKPVLISLSGSRQASKVSALPLWLSADIISEEDHLGGLQRIAEVSNGHVRDPASTKEAQYRQPCGLLLPAVPNSLPDRCHRFTLHPYFLFRGLNRVNPCFTIELAPRRCITFCLGGSVHRASLYDGTDRKALTMLGDFGWFCDSSPTVAISKTSS